MVTTETGPTVHEAAKRARERYSCFDRFGELTAEWEAGEGPETFPFAL